MNHNGPCYTIQEQGRKNCGTCEMSVAQQAFVEGELRRHRQVTICRIMLLVLLLALWELVPTCTGLTASSSVPPP